MSDIYKFGEVVAIVNGGKHGSEFWDQYTSSTISNWNGTSVDTWGKKKSRFVKLMNSRIGWSQKINNIMEGSQL